MGDEAKSREKVGVIVIHGVGETAEGWIDSYLVPELEKWAAYENVTGLDRRPASNALTLVARTKDDKFVAVGLDNDDDFRKFCAIVADPRTAEDVLFKTADARRKNRDQLYFLLKSAFDEADASEWLAELASESVPCSIAFSPLSEVHHVRDPDSTEQTSTWASFTRRCELSSKDLIVSELYWADMSKIGTTNVSRSSAIVQLFLESPFVLGETLLKGSDRGVHRLIAGLVYISNWLMRWPIAGLTLPVFVTAFTYLAIQQFLPIDRTPATVASILGVISVLAFASFRQTAHRKVGLADLSLSTAVCAFLLIIAVAGFAFTGSASAQTKPEFYLVAGFMLLMGAWTLWTLVIVPAAGLVTLVALKRLVLPGGRKPPLARASLAISLNLLLGMVWKLILPLVGVLAINTLVESGASPEVSKTVAKGAGEALANTCGTTTITPFTIFSVSIDCQLAWVKKFLLTVSLLNFGAIVAVGACVALLLLVRGSLSRVFETRAINKRLSLPRLITSTWIVATLFAVSCFNAVFAFTPRAHVTLPEQFDGSFGVGASVVGLIAIFFLLQRLVEMSNSYVHIGRDLVDHQYGASYRPLTSWLLPPDATDPDSTAQGFRAYRRRRRIQRRLEALIDEVIAQLQIDRLIFLTHSQGTVIMHDYLDNHDNLVAKTHADRQSLFDVKRIDVVTLGSPLTHLYRYYFSDYEASTAPGGKGQTLMRRVESWTNMWRIDDPIGQAVDFIEGIDNIPMKRGGHMDYWKEAPVCARIWALVRDPSQQQKLVHPA